MSCNFMSCNLMPCNFDGPSFLCPSFSAPPSTEKQRNYCSASLLFLQVFHYDLIICTYFTHIPASSTTINDVSGADSTGNGGYVPPTSYIWLGMKVLTKTTNCAFRAKKWRGTTKNFFFWRIGALHFRSGPVPPTFKFVPAPLNDVTTYVTHRIFKTNVQCIIFKCFFCSQL